MSQIRIAVIGSGYFSQFHLAAWQRLHSDGAEICGLLSLDEQSANAMCERFSIASRYRTIDELIADAPDIVDVIVPPEAQLALIRTLADAGITVICQKPFCSTLEEARIAVSYFASKNVPLIVHENFRHQPWYRAIKAELDQGRLGELYQISFRIRPGDGQGADAYLARQPYFREQSQFLVRETAVHWIDVFRFLAGEIEAVFASLTRLNPIINGEDAGIMLLQFASGARGLIDGNRLSDHNAENTRLTMGEMLIEGEKGVITLNGTGAVSFRAHGSQSIEPINFDWQNIDFAGDCVYLTQKHILNSVFGDDDISTRAGTDKVQEAHSREHDVHVPENTADQYLINRVVERCVYESSEQGCWLAVSALS